MQSYRADIKALPFATAIEAVGENPILLRLSDYRFTIRACSSSTCNRRERKQSAVSNQREGQVHRTSLILGVQVTFVNISISLFAPKRIKLHFTLRPCNRQKAKERIGVTDISPSATLIFIRNSLGFFLPRENFSSARNLP